MVLPRVFIAYLARELTWNLGRDSCDFAYPEAVQDVFETVIIDELSLEDEINTEVRALLNQYSTYMRRERIPYQEMFRKVKRKILAERRAISASAREAGGRRMKLSRAKIVEMSHKLAAVLPRVPGTRMKKSWNDVRLEIVRAMTEILTKEETVDKIAHEKINSQKREIPEGSEEWNLLYRRYYEEEMKRYGIDLSMPA